MILSDHKPFQGLFNETKGIPLLASARIQRWALTLSAYDYTIQHKKGAEKWNADMLSHLPLPETPVQVPEPGDTILLLQTLDKTPVTASQIRVWTDRDRTLSKVRDMILQGWQPSNSEDLKVYQKLQTELTVVKGCVLRGNRVVIPTIGRSQILKQIYETHPGICRMKNIARSYYWWPKIDKDIEAKVKECQTCQLVRPANHPETIQPWEWPTKPWLRLHLDYAGPVNGKMYLILVDAHSKWLEVRQTNTATSSVTITHLHSIFSVHRLPEVVVTDNGTVFTSAEFEEYLKLNGIRHIRTAPYHPALNGQAERAVKIFKQHIKTNSGITTPAELERFLFRYRLTPHTTTGISPAELLLGRRPRSHLDLARPDLQREIQQKQLMQQAKRGGKAEKRVCSEIQSLGKSI